MIVVYFIFSLCNFVILRVALCYSCYTKFLKVHTKFHKDYIRFLLNIDFYFCV